MKKRKFYSSKKRDVKWTEEPKGHEIDFADKYIGSASASDKFDKRRKSYQLAQKKKKKENVLKRLKAIGAVLICLVIVCIGYTAMDVHMTRNAKPLSHIGNGDDENEISISDLALDISAYKVESVSLDASVMLSSVTNELTEAGFNSLVFDAKRSDGTIGYASSLATIDTFSAVSNASSNPKNSIKQLIDNDILPIARICCYQDNLAPNQDGAIALKNGKRLYADKDGNTYLNPNSPMTYSYIKDIITELNEYGITVFILSGCNLPEEISDKYEDGFDKLSSKLNKDFNSGIKLLEEVNVSISGRDAETGKITSSAIRSEIAKLDKINKNQILFITTKADSDKVKAQLSKNNFNCYVIGE